MGESSHPTGSGGGVTAFRRICRDEMRHGGRGSADRRRVRNGTLAIGLTAAGKIRSRSMAETDA
jgi:hypothetical protein